jgi:hypothetical protein
MMEHACNLSTEEAEAGGSQVQNQFVLHSKTLSQKNQNPKTKQQNQTIG